ncbi:MAG: cytochrome c oxidase accessory protein CcoG [Phycisphaerales bacterium]
MQPPERVLSTLNPDGSRRWMRPKESPGRFLTWRRLVGWFLIVVFAVLPWLRIDGQPPILLDVMRRHFVFFGTVFRPTDTLLLALLILSVFITIFLLTALVGRVWCGWGCPQTVYMEFVFRPLERFFLGRAYANSKQSVAAWRRVAMYLTFLVVSAHLANTFLAYFVGTDQLTQWTFKSPTEHSTAFLVFLVTTGLMMFDFAFYREQMCTLVCPYGRFQSVLLDRDSVIVGYDRLRGEPRGKKKAEGVGDCIDCTLCVQTCPTGIDIRDGLQLECIHCAQCIDACDAVMTKLGRAPGLIRYSSQNRLEQRQGSRFRFRMVVYPLLLIGALTAFVTLLVTRKDAMVVALRTEGTPYVVGADGTVTNTLRLRIDNRTKEDRTYHVEAEPGTVLREPAEVTVEPASNATVTLHILSHEPEFLRGRREIGLRIFDGKSFDEKYEFSIIGPFGALNSKEHSP